MVTENRPGSELRRRLAEAMLAAYLASHGIHALEVEFPYYGPRQPEDQDAEGRILRGDITTWPVPIRQAVADILRAAAWLRSIANRMAFSNESERPAPKPRTTAST